MNTKQKGDVAVAQCISKLSLLGYEILLPLGDRKPYDLVYDKDGELKRVQVKYAGLNVKGKYSAQLRIVGGNKTRIKAQKYLSTDFDELFIFTEGGDCYMLPWDIVIPRNAIAIDSPKYEKFKIS